MSKLIRVFQKHDIDEIKKHLLIYGDLSGACANCQRIDIKLETNLCPQCKTEIRYISFRNIKEHMAKLTKLTEQRPSVKILDFDDYKRATGASRVEDFFK